ncbi:MAG: hypothetical protein Q9195_007789 [Heterodermia aff. obscurata]
MAKDYMRFLAVHVISESQIISYRMLSRELKVHCNAAKRMLYEFHTHENKKKPGSVHAAYLLYGTQNAKTSNVNGDTHRDGEDIPMASSPFLSSSMPQDEDTTEVPPAKVMTVVREENLEAVKAQYEEILSIHIYSLSPGPINNVHMLSDCNRQINTKFAHEDPLVFNEKYGVIQNPRVKRRTGARPPPPPAVIEPAKPTSYRPEPKKTDTKSTKAPDRLSSSTTTAPKSETSVLQHKPSETKSVDKKPALKKETSDIFKSFGKTKAPATKPRTEETNTGTASIAANTKEDAPRTEPMKDASESEQEEDFMPSTTTSTKANPKSSGPSRSERKETLRKMMDEDSDEEMSNAPPEETSPPPPVVDSPAPSAKEPSPPPPITASGGRRRGRRKVMRKKTVKDEEGYIVTKEEPAWESFSEDEPPHPQAAAKKVQLPTPASRGGRKSGPKAGQGNIMNFFGKK